jgi:hypothetical protein
MLDFKKYENAGAATLEEVGTLKENAGKGGKIALIRKNYSDLTKRVAVLITKKDGTSAVVPCSAQVSKALRAEELTIAQLANLNIVSGEDKEGNVRHFVAMPATGAIQEFAVDTIKAAKVETKSEFLPAALVAF